VERQSKLKPAEEAFALIKSGSTIAMTCTHYNSVPMAAIRQIIRMGVKDLTVMTTPSAGLAVDLLIAAGCVRKAFVSYVGLEFMGMAPNFRRAVERGEIEVSDVDETSVVLGYRAAATGLPFALLPAFYKLTSLPTVNPAVFREIQDPFTGALCYAMPPLKPDVGIIHVQQADIYGNARQLGGHHTEALIAKASDHVIITTEEVIPHEAVMAEPTLTVVPGLLVDAVVRFPYGAHPGSCPTRYNPDEGHLAEYARLAQEGRTREYIEQFVLGTRDQSEYLDRIGASQLVSLHIG
jgi:glutaconate CoA-transferase, subunit A